MRGFEPPTSSPPGLHANRAALHPEINVTKCYDDRRKKSRMCFLKLEMEKSWIDILGDELEKPYMKKLFKFLEKEKGEVYPEKKNIFKAFFLTPFKDVRVVILGQDPYHGPHQAQGLCFSVMNGCKIPPSLKNIYKELQDDLGINPVGHGCLEKWAKQGVLLLNAILTVRNGEPLSHAEKGWERFTDTVIEKLFLKKDPVVFLLWGKFAQSKCKSVLHENCDHHLILTAAHPSPFSAKKFLGCKHFSKANEFLISVGKKPINWELT